MTVTTVDRTALETKVKDMYTDVAENPHGEFHFEMGRAMAERLGYAPADLDRVPQDAIDSFAGVGYFFHLADLTPGERGRGPRQRIRHGHVRGCAEGRADRTRGRR